MPKITILDFGLEPDTGKQRTVFPSLDAESHVYTRSSHHPSLNASRLSASLTDLNDTLLNQESVISAIQDIVSIAERENVIYICEPGGAVFDSFAAQLAEEARKKGIPIEYQRQVGGLEDILYRAGLSSFQGLAIMDCLYLVSCHVPPFPPTMPAALVGVNSQEMSAIIKKNLRTVYPLNYRVTILGYDEVGNWCNVEVSLDNLPQNPVRANGIIYIPAMGKDTSFESFQELVAHLRSPEGCPWDREQTHATLRTNLLEETYEALAAIDKSDWQSLCEELGDLLLQIFLHAQIASENGEFSLPQLIHTIHSKLVRRHPHVFAQLDVDGIGGILRNWEDIKAKERKSKGEERKGILDGVPISYPALAQAQEIQARAARVGFDWKEIQPVFDKIFEEIEELKQAKDAASISSEIGDLLFAVVNISRWMGVDAESALRETNIRFRQRFQHVEEQSRRQGKELKNMTLQEMDVLWEQAKSMEGGK